MSDEQTSLNLPETGRPGLPSLDIAALTRKVASKHGVLLKPEDPILVSATIFEEAGKALAVSFMAALDEAQDRMTATAIEQQKASRDVAERIVNEGGAYIAERIKTAGQTMAPAVSAAVLAAIEPTLAKVDATAKTARRDKIVALAAAGVAIVAAVASAGLYAGSLAA